MLYYALFKKVFTSCLSIKNYFKLINWLRWVIYLLLELICRLGLVSIFSFNWSWISGISYWKFGIILLNTIRSERVIWIWAWFSSSMLCSVRSLPLFFFCLLCSVTLLPGCWKPLPLRPEEARQLVLDRWMVQSPQLVLKQIKGN